MIKVPTSSTPSQPVATAAEPPTTVPVATTPNTLPAKKDGSSQPTVIAILVTVVTAAGGVVAVLFIPGALPIVFGIGTAAGLGSTATVAAAGALGLLISGGAGVATRFIAIKVQDLDQPPPTQATLATDPTKPADAEPGDAPGPESKDAPPQTNPSGDTGDKGKTTDADPPAADPKVPPPPPAPPPPPPPGGAPGQAPLVRLGANEGGSLRLFKGAAEFPIPYIAKQNDGSLTRTDATREQLTSNGYLPRNLFANLSDSERVIALAKYEPLLDQDLNAKSANDPSQEPAEKLRQGVPGSPGTAGSATGGTSSPAVKPSPPPVTPPGPGGVDPPTPGPGAGGTTGKGTSPTGPGAGALKWPDGTPDECKEKYKDLTPAKVDMLVTPFGDKGLVGSPLSVMLAPGQSLQDTKGNKVKSVSLIDGQIPAGLIYQDDAYFLTAAYGPNVLASKPGDYPARPAPAAPGGADAAIPTPIPGEPPPTPAGPPKPAPTPSDPVPAVKPNPTPTPPKSKTPDELAEENLAANGLTVGKDGNICYGEEVLHNTSGRPIPFSTAKEWVGAKIPIIAIYRDDVISFKVSARALVADISKYRWRTIPSDQQRPRVSDGAARKAAIAGNGIKGIHTAGKGRSTEICSVVVGSGRIEVSESIVTGRPSATRKELTDKNGGKITDANFDAHGKIAPEFFSKEQLTWLITVAPDILNGGEVAAKKLIDDPQYMPDYVPA